MYILIFLTKRQKQEKRKEKEMIFREICKWQVPSDQEKWGFGKTRTHPMILVKQYS